MGFLVHLKGEDAPIRVDADKAFTEDEVYQFSKEGAGRVASFPVANVSHVVKDQPGGERK